MTLLQVEALTKTFVSGGSLLPGTATRVQAVRGVSLEIAQGETLGLVGESGCGKSTLGRCVIRLVQPTSGRVVFAGEEVTAAQQGALRSLRRRMQIIFQDPYSSLNPRQRVGDSIMEGMEIHRIETSGRRRELVAELLENVGLKPDHARSFPHEFSGGQRQRIVIARALAVGPQFIVADEAVSALDVSIQAQILNLLLELQSKMNLTYLFISHNLHVVRHISDRVAVMYLGRIVETAPADEIYQRPRHPYTKALLSAALKPDPDKPAERVALMGDVPSPINPPSGCAFRTRCPIAEEICAKIDPQLAFSGSSGVACHKATP